MEHPGSQVLARRQLGGISRVRVPCMTTACLVISVLAFGACGLEPADHSADSHEEAVVEIGPGRMWGAGEAPLPALARDAVPDAVSDMVPDAPHITLPVPAAEEVGALPASAGVAGGAAVYTLPIALPPGRRGMQPAVALGYASRAGDGVAGVGWRSWPAAAFTAARAPWPRTARIET